MKFYFHGTQLFQTSVVRRGINFIKDKHDYSIKEISTRSLLSAMLFINKNKSPGYLEMKAFIALALAVFSLKRLSV